MSDLIDRKKAIQKFRNYQRDCEDAQDVHSAAVFSDVITELEDLPAVGAATENDSEQLCTENENFIQTKFGYCFYTLDSLPFIYNLYVHPQYRRSGHSRVFLNLIISEIRKSGYKGEIYIQAEPKENSIGQADLENYYESMGLTIYAARESEGSKKS